MSTDIHTHYPPLPPAWRIEGRATPFTPWVVVRMCHEINDACKRSVWAKRQYRFYAVRVRAN